MLQTKTKSVNSCRDYNFEPSEKAAQKRLCSKRKMLALRQLVVEITTIALKRIFFLGGVKQKKKCWCSEAEDEHVFKGNVL